MATARALRNDSVTLSSSFLDYLFCCFARNRVNDRSNSSRVHEGRETKDIADRGSSVDSERQHATSQSVDREDDTDLDEATRNENDKDDDNDDDYYDNDDDDAGLDDDTLEPKSSTPVSRPTRTQSKSPSRSNKSNESGAGVDVSVNEAIHHSPPQDENFPETPSSASSSHRAVDGNHVSCDKDSQLLAPTARRSKSEIDRMEGKAGGRRGGGGGISEEERKSSVVAAIDGNGSLFGLQAPAAEAAAAATTSANASHDASDIGLFDASDLPLTAHSTASRCGSVRTTFSYSDQRERMTVTVHEAQGVEGGGGCGGDGSAAPRQTQVRMLLLPLRKIRQKTKLRPTEKPQFEESFEFRVPQADLGAMGLRVRLYGCERMRRETLKGEAIVNFSSINTIDPFHTLWIDLKPPGSLGHGDSISDVSSQTHSENSSGTSGNLSIHHVRSPELMIGLAYNGSTGHLSVEILKGTNFKNAASKRPPDTFVKMTLVGARGRELTSSKTSVRRSQPNPTYKETFVFQIAQSQLTDVSLMVSAFVRRSFKTKEMFGWFTMGQTNSSGEDQSHWTAMINSKGQQVCQWHTLLEP